MATVKTILYKSKTLADGSHPVMLRVTIGNKRKYVSLNRSLHDKFWDKKRGNINDKYPSKYKAGDKQYSKQALSSFIDKRQAAAINILTKYEQSGKVFGIDTFISEFQQKLKTKETFFSYFEGRINDLQTKNRAGYADVHRNALNAFKAYRSRDIDFIDLASKVFEDFIQYHENRGISGNSISVHLRTMRTVLKSAIGENYLHENPINHEIIQKVETEPDKRAISTEDMRKVFFLDVSDNPQLQFAKDMFLFSFFAQGMAFIDIALLKYSNLKPGNVIKYERKKLKHSRGKKTVTVPLNNEALSILNKYRKSDFLKSDYIFPILNKEVHISDRQISDRVRKKRRQVNVSLKEISILLKLDVTLTTYVSRHSYASSLVHRGASVLTVMDTMGHSSLDTTQKYIKSLNLDDIRATTMDLLGLGDNEDKKKRNISIKPDQHESKQAQ